MSKARVLVTPDVPQAVAQPDLVHEIEAEEGGPDPVTALMRQQPPMQPPHAVKGEGDESDIEYEQSWAGWEQSARRMFVWHGILEQLGAVLSGGQQMALIDMKLSWPTGKKDIEHNMIVAEMDLATLTQGMEVKDRDAWLRATYNYAVREFTRWSKSNAKYSTTHARLLAPPSN